MGADEGAHIALQALILIPHRQMGGNTALFIAGGAKRHSTIFHTAEGGHREIVALLGVDGHENVADDIGQASLRRRDGSAGELLPAFLDVHLHQCVDTGIHGLQVHVDDLLALEGIGLADGGLHVLHGILHGDDIGKFEEGGLQHHVGAVAQTQRLRLTVGIDDVELNVVLGDVAEDVAGYLLLQLALAPLAVQQEGAAGLQLRDNVVLGEIGLVMAGNEIRHIDIVGGTDGLLTKTQMGLGDTEGLLRIVLEVGLAVHIGGLADDLNGVLVGTHRTVGAETPELAGDGALRLRQQCRAQRQGQVGHIVLNADGEVILGRIQQQVIIHRLQLDGRGILAGQTKATCVDEGAGRIVDVGGADVLIEGLTDRTSLLHAVENGNLLHRLGHGGKEMLGREGTEQMYLQEAHLFALSVEILHHLAGTAGHRTHGHHHAVSIGCAIVVEQVIIAARQGVDLGHVVLHHIGQSIIIAVVGLAELEVDVGVIHQRAHAGIFGVQGIGAERSQRIVVHQLCIVIVLQHIDLLDLVGSAETIKEMQERDAGTDGAQMGHRCHIGALLHAAGAEHGKARLTAVHHVRMIAEDGKSVGTHRTGCYVEHAGQTLTGDTVHGGDHQHQALRGGEAGGQSTCFQCAVASTAGACLRLHLHKTHGLIENILLSVGRPFIGLLRHGRRGGNGINGGYLREGIRYVCGGFVTVTDLHDLAHL